MNDVRLLIVEDESLVAKDLSHRLSQMGYGIVGITDNAKGAMDILHQHSVDLCLLDIRLSDKIDGIKLAHQINAQFQLPIIFLTSYADPVTLERAKDARPSAYMLKPFQDKELQIAIEIAVSNYAQNRVAATLSESRIPLSYDQGFCLKRAIFIKQKERFIRIDIPEIQWVEADNNYSLIYTASGKKYCLTTNLGEIEKHLSDKEFIRIHRSFIINLNHISALEGNQVYIGKKSFSLSKQKRDLLQNLRII